MKSMTKRERRDAKSAWSNALLMATKDHHVAAAASGLSLNVATRLKLAGVEQGAALELMRLLLVDLQQVVVIATTAALLADRGQDPCLVTAALIEEGNDFPDPDPWELEAREVTLRPALRQLGEDGYAPSKN